MGALGYRELIVWQRAMDSVESIYLATRDWPREEVYGLTGQARRAAVAVPANIAEGHGRTEPKVFLHHLSIAKRLRYVDESSCDALLAQTAEVGRLRQGLIKSLRRSADGD